MKDNLPEKGDQITGWIKRSKAMCTSPPVMNNNGAHKACIGNASWVGNKLTFADEGVMNYWYLPQAETEDNGISYCVVPCANKTPDAYVLSDNYGGCEFHELWNAAYQTLAFIHVLRAGGKVSEYFSAPGWVLRSVKRSAPIVRAGGAVAGTNLSITYIDRSKNPPVVETKFIRVKMGAFTHGPVTGTVELEDDGNGPNVS